MGLVGFGLDYNYREHYPGRLSGLCHTFSNRLSHLSIVALRTIDEARAFRDLAGSLPVVHHLSNIAPGNPKGIDWDRVALQDEMSHILQASWCGEDIGIWSFGPYSIPYFIPPVLEPEIAVLTGSAIAELQSRISLRFAAEVPTCTFLAGHMTLGEFFHEIVRLGRCDVVLDLSHVFSYALLTATSPAALLDTLPLDSVCEIHIAGGKISPKYSYRYIDTHNHPVVDQVLELLELSVPKCKGLRCVTFELGESLALDTIETDFYKIENVLATLKFTPAFGVDPERAQHSAH